MTMGDLQPAPSVPETGLLSVSEVHEEIGRALEGAGLTRVWVSGVISGLRRGPRFSNWELVEYAEDAATVRAVLPVGAFARQAAEISAVLAEVGLELADGLEVAVWGRLDPNPAYGRLRLLAEGIDPRASIGAAVVARDRVVAELQASGLLAAQQALSVPDTLRRIGLISSPGAAGRADVLAVLDRCPVPLDVVEVAAAMAGPRAPDQVARALGLLGTSGVDLILVARGGGARSDLAPWDSPDLACAIARCPTPVWVALGHASDRTVADLAANRSHPAPSAAAAAIVAILEAAAQRQAQATTATEHSAALATAQRRQRHAMAVAAVVLVVLMTLIWITAG